MKNDASRSESKHKNIELHTDLQTLHFSALRFLLYRIWTIAKKQKSKKSLKNEIVLVIGHAGTAQGGPEKRIYHLYLDSIGAPTSDYGRDKSALRCWYTPSREGSYGVSAGLTHSNY